MSYKLKARYLGDSIIITVKHPGGEYNKKIINFHQQIANKTIDFKQTQTSHDEIEYHIHWGTEHGFHLSVVVFDLVNECTNKIDLSNVKVYLITDDYHVIPTELIPRIESPSYPVLHDNFTERENPAYKINAEYIGDAITITVNHDGEEYIDEINDIRKYISIDDIDYVQPEDDYCEARYTAIRDTRQGFYFFIKLHDFVNKETRAIDNSYVKVDIVTSTTTICTTPFVQRIDVPPIH